MTDKSVLTCSNIRKTFPKLKLEFDFSINEILSPAFRLVPCF